MQDVGEKAKEVQRLHEQLAKVYDEAISIEALLDGHDVLEEKTQPSAASIEERMESLHASLEDLDRKLGNIHRRVLQVLRQI